MNVYIAASLNGEDTLHDYKRVLRIMVARIDVYHLDFYGYCSVYRGIN